MDTANGRAGTAARLQQTALQADAARRLVNFWSSNTAPEVPAAPGSAAPPPAEAARPDKAAAPMRILVKTNPHRVGGHPLAGHVKSLLAEALSRYGERVTRVDAHLADESGRRKTHDDEVECTLQASLAGLEPVVVKEQAANAHDAVQGAVAKLRRAVGAALGKSDPRRPPPRDEPAA